MTLSYELARELKDAGFPKIRIGENFNHTVGNHSDDRGGASDYPCDCMKDYFPTLEELINASPMLHGISRYRNGRRSVKGWWVFGLKSELDSFSEWYEGSTLEEALARYWLAVHNRE